MFLKHVSDTEKNISKLTITRKNANLEARVVRNISLFIFITMFDTFVTM